MTRNESGRNHERVVDPLEDLRREHDINDQMIKSKYRCFFSIRFFAESPEMLRGDSISIWVFRQRADSRRDVCSGFWLFR